MSDQWGYTVDEVAAILKVSKHTVLRRAKELGAVQIAGNEGSIKVRRYRVLRFPRVALEKYLTKLSGSPVVLSSLTIPQTRKARADWQETATRKLAEIASANSNGIPERAVFARIARNARTLCFVNREEWKDVVFYRRRGLAAEAVRKGRFTYFGKCSIHGRLARKGDSERIQRTEP